MTASVKSIFCLLLWLGVGFLRAATNIIMPPEVSSPIIFLMDVNTRQVLYEKDGYVPTAPSSMGKIMVLYMLFEQLKAGKLTLSTPMMISEKAWRTGGSKMFVEVGKQVSVEDLIRGIAVVSGNDGSIVVAENLGGTEDHFADLMTERAHELGARTATFKNASGLPHPEHKMSAADLAIISLKTLEDFPEYYKYYGETEYTYNEIRQPNRLTLLGKYPGMDGIKTGHTDDAGFGMIASAVQNGRRLILVINGAKDEKARAHDAEVLLNWGFREFEDLSLAVPGKVLDTVSVIGGVAPRVNITVESPISLTLPRQMKKDIKMQALYKGGVLKAPLQKGQKVGELRVTLGDRVIVSPLITMESVEEKGIWARGWDSVKRLIS